MDKVLDKLKESFPKFDPWVDIKANSKFTVEQVQAREVKNMLKDKKKVMILTGAGISAASGIPTFRGSKGIWKQKYKYCDRPEDLATRFFFDQHPEVVWEFTWDFIELVQKSKPNAGHVAVEEI